MKSLFILLIAQMAGERPVEKSAWHPGKLIPCYKSKSEVLKPLKLYKNIIDLVANALLETKYFQIQPASKKIECIFTSLVEIYNQALVEHQDKSGKNINSINILFHLLQLKNREDWCQDQKPIHFDVYIVLEVILINAFIGAIDGGRKNKLTIEGALETLSRIDDVSFLNISNETLQINSVVNEEGKEIIVGTDLIEHFLFISSYEKLFDFYDDLFDGVVSKEISRLSILKQICEDQHYQELLQITENGSIPDNNETKSKKPILESFFSFDAWEWLQESSELPTSKGSIERQAASPSRLSSSKAFPFEFKLKAVQLARKTDVPSAAKELHIPESHLITWLSTANKKKMPDSVNNTKNKL